MLAALVLALMGSPEAPVRRFGDWFVACDNNRACTAGSLRRDDAADGMAVIVLRISPAPAAPHLAVLLPQGAATPVRADVDGRALPLDLRRHDDWVDLVSRGGADLVAALAAGEGLHLRDRQGTEVATLSLAGAAAAMLAIDEAQHRLGTQVALVRRGAKTARTIAPPPSHPRIRAIRASGTAPMPLTPAQIRRARAEAECEGATSDATAYPLDRTHRLVLIGCESAAYNFTSIALVVDANGRPDGAAIDRAAIDANSDGMLGNPVFHDGILSTSVKARGVGDCGAAQSFVWDGHGFVTIEVSRQDECGGNPEWPILYRATPVWQKDTSR